MSSGKAQQGADRRTRSLAVAWALGSLVVGIAVGVTVFVSSGTRLAAETAPTALPTGTAEPGVAPQVVTKSPPDETPGVKLPEAPVGEMVPIDAFGYGIQVHGSVGDPEVALGHVERLGLGWIKQQVRWGELELSPGDLNWGMIDGIMRAARESQTRVMLSVVTAPAWSRPALGNTHGPPEDLNQFTAFLSKLIEHYPRQISAIEVWNEQNLDREWQAEEGLSAERYVEMLRMAYGTIKDADPGIVVISGALAPTGGWVEPDGRVTAIDDFVYFEQLLQAGLPDYADCVGAHHNGYNIGPDVAAEAAPDEAEATSATFRGPFDNVHHSWSFKSTLLGYSEMMQGRKKLCVTEFGWASSEGVGGTPPGFGFADDNTLQEQADWIVEAFQLQREWGVTWLAFLWNLDYGPKGLGPEDNNVPYSILNMDGSPRPAFGSLETMPKP